MDTILGIDLGTTNSAVSIIRDGQVTVLEEDGQKALPSVVGLDPAGKLLVGLDVFQGEDKDVRHNQEIGGFDLDGLADARQGNEILVRFDLDLDGILTVAATEKLTGLEEGLTIENAMSRFRSEDREAAKTRIEAAFSGDEIAAADRPPRSAADPHEDLSPELREVIGKANELLAQANRLTANANQQDAEEMRELVDQLREAVQARSPGDIQDASAKLDDLVFYLREAT